MNRKSNNQTKNPISRAIFHANTTSKQRNTCLIGNKEMKGKNRRANKLLARHDRYKSRNTLKLEKEDKKARQAMHQTADVLQHLGVTGTACR